MKLEHKNVHNDIYTATITTRNRPHCVRGYLLYFHAHHSLWVKRSVTESPEQSKLDCFHIVLQNNKKVERKR